MVFSRLGRSFSSAFSGPGIEKFVAKLTSKTVIVPVVYSFITIFIFALVYALIGYKNHFETNDTNKDKNIENSVIASIMLQSNAMGSVTPITSLGAWLSAAQVMVGWLWYLCIVYIVI
ncbi:hypothetical protein PBCVCviKI_672L [Paramecium bursaria Chlorella virus CviKI]|nr:hypothetical protein PBCVCviKI_672L [Paramecium bursaria Chlorella virus CviKI]